VPFLGKTPTVGNFILLDSITVSNTATFALTKDSLDYYPGSAQNLIVSVNGVTQAPLAAYTITDNNIVFASALDSDVDVIDYILVLGDTLNIGRPSDGTVGATQIQDYAVTSVKMSNTGVGAATYGTSTSIPQITIDAAGRITSATGIDRSNQFEDLTVTGNLTVSGNTVTVDAQTLSVEDPLIHLAANNETSDVVDIGFVGHYSNDGGTTKLHTGFFRDASDEEYYLFNGFEDDNLDLSSPSTTIDRTANTFTLADLNTGRLNTTTDSNITASFTSTTTTAKIAITDANDTAFIDVNATRLGIGHSSSTSLQALQIEPTIAEAMRIDSDGNVGIGTNNPSSPNGFTRNLTISGSSCSLALDETDSNTWEMIASSGSFRIYDETNERMRIDSGGNVGIGTSIPSQTLSVVGTIQVERSTAGIFKLKRDDTETATGNGIGEIHAVSNHGGTDFIASKIRFEVGDNRATDGEISLQTSGIERLRIDSNGNVGIGAPAVSGVNAPLDVDKSPVYNNCIANFGEFVPLSGYQRGVVNINGRVNGTDYDSSLSFVRRNSSNSNWLNGLIGLDVSGEMYFSTGGVAANASTERMRIDSGGNVGIGTTAASGIQGSLHIHSSSGDNGDGDGLVNFGDESTVIISTNATTAGGQGYYGSLFFGGQDVSSATQQVWKLAGFSAYSPADIGTTGSADLLFYTTQSSSTPTERMRIDSNGNVGIGVAPSAVNQSYISGAYTEAIIKGNSANKIGSLQLRSYGSTYATHFELAASDGSAASYLWNGTNSAMVFGTNNTERMRIRNDGIIEQQGLQKKVYTVTVPNATSGVTRTWEIIDPSLAHRQFGIITLLCGRSGNRQQRVYHRYYFNSSNFANEASMTTIETPLNAGFTTCSVTYSSNKIYLNLRSSTDAITDAFRVIIEGVFVDHLDPSSYSEA